jgi:hypothetical protein
MLRHRRALAVGAVLVALLAACGGDDDDASGTTTTQSDDGSTTSTDGSSSTGDDGVVTDGVPEPGATDSPSVDIEALPPVAVGEAADFGGGLFATVTKVEQVDLEAQAPGETGGPGILVTVELFNDTADPVDLGGVSVNASYGDGTPAIPHQTGPATPLAGTLDPGERSTGSYTFRVPAGQAGSAVIDVHHADQVSYVIVDVDGAVQ